MVDKMVKATTLVLDTWEQKIRNAGGSTQLDINNDMKTITSHVISHTTFGNNYKEGEQMFQQMEALVRIIAELFTNPFFFLPGFRFFPTTRNRSFYKLIHQNEKILEQVIRIRQKQARTNEIFCAKDILDLMMSTNCNNDKRKVLNETTCQLNIQNLVDECKTLFLAGYATTSLFLTWTMLLLAEYPEWQERARIEILEVCGFNNDMDVTKLNQMKIVGMILNEVHRLFPVLPQLTRVASKDMQLKDIFVPKGLILEIPVLHMHHDLQLWGENVMEFDPNRFAKGVSKACQHQQSFIPFSFGPRNCLGQYFSLMESKVVVATVLSRFQLSISPSYKHCPHNPFLHSPKFGVQLIIKKIDT
jgi:cytochrome P450